MDIMSVGLRKSMTQVAHRIVTTGFPLVGIGCGCDKLLTFSPVPNTRHSRDTSNGEQR